MDGKPSMSGVKRDLVEVKCWTGSNGALVRLVQMFCIAGSTMSCREVGSIAKAYG